MMPISRFASIVLLATCLVRAEDINAQRLESSTTQSLDFPAGGVLHMTNAIGEITVEGWDQPGMEITVIKSTKNVLDSKSKDAAKDKAADTKELDAMKITAERKGDEVLVLTSYPKHEVFARPFFGRAYVDVEYRIKVPRAARIDIDQYSGETHIENISGEIRVNAVRGEITVREPDGQYSIEARSKFGSVASDFPGIEKGKKIFGETFAASSKSTTPRKLFLTIGYGDILILKIH